MKQHKVTPTSLLAIVKDVQRRVNLPSRELQKAQEANAKADEALAVFEKQNSTYNRLQRASERAYRKVQETRDKDRTDRIRDAAECRLEIQTRGPTPLAVRRVRALAKKYLGLKG